MLSFIPGINCHYVSPFVLRCTFTSEREGGEFTGTWIELTVFRVSRIKPLHCTRALAMYFRGMPAIKSLIILRSARTEESLFAHGNYFPNNKMATPRTNTTTNPVYSAGRGKARPGSHSALPSYRITTNRVTIISLSRKNFSILTFPHLFYRLLQH